MKIEKMFSFILLFLLNAVCFISTLSYAAADPLATLGNPSLLSTILLAAAVVLLIVEMFLPTFGIAGILSFLSFVGFFYLNLTLGNAEILHLIIFIIGCILLGIEVFVPSFGFIGIAGIALILIGIFLATGDLYTGLLTLSIAVILSTILLYIFIKHGYKHRIFDPIILRTNEPKADPVKRSSLPKLVGQTGIALSPLRPAGVMKIGERRIDVVTEGEFIDKGEDITVISVNGNIVKVRRT